MDNPNPYDAKGERKHWLRWQISDELAASIAPGLGSGDEGARRVLIRWLTGARERLVNHLYGAMRVHARYAGIEHFTHEDIAAEVALVAWSHGLREKS